MHSLQVCPYYQLFVLKFDTFTMHDTCYKFIYSEIRDLPYALQTPDRRIHITTFAICTKCLEHIVDPKLCAMKLGADEL